MKEKIKIAAGQGFWGDLIDAPFQQVTKGNVDYLVLDYLAEVTMSILQKQKNKNPDTWLCQRYSGIDEKNSSGLPAKRH